MKHEFRNWLRDSGGFTPEAQAPVGACLEAMGWLCAWGGVGDASVDEEGDRAAYLAMEDSSGRGEGRGPFGGGDASEKRDR